MSTLQEMLYGDIAAFRALKDTPAGALVRVGSRFAVVRDPIPCGAMGEVVCSGPFFFHVDAEFFVYEGATVYYSPRTETISAAPIRGGYVLGTALLTTKPGDKLLLVQLNG